MLTLLAAFFLCTKPFLSFKKFAKAQGRPQKYFNSEKQVLLYDVAARRKVFIKIVFRISIIIKWQLITNDYTQKIP